MKLEEKGPIQPVPVLAGPSQKTIDAILSWPAIISASHWAFRLLLSYVDISK